MKMLNRLIMNSQRVFVMPFARVYLLCITGAERKGRTKAEVDEIIIWLTGYNANSLIDF